MTSALLAALTSAGCTAGLGLACRRKLIKLCADDDLVEELKERGVDLGAMDKEALIERNYEIIQSLGKGSSGCVFKVRDRRMGSEARTLAMKVMEKGGTTYMNDEEALKTEIGCMKKLRHRHIVNLIDYVESPDKVWILMDCADGGGLYERILALSHFSEVSASSVIKQILKAVHYMHGMGVVHRDLKPENVLLENKELDCDVKVADFGLAVDLEWSECHQEESMKMKGCTDITGGFCGSPICMAPEVAVKSAKYGPQCDVWSIGCMAYELLSGHPPFSAKSARALFKVIREGPGPIFKDAEWHLISKEAPQIIIGMLQKDPKNRPSAGEALHHSWFKLAKDHHLEDVHATHRSRKTGKTISSQDSIDELETPYKAPEEIKA